VHVCVRAFVPVHNGVDHHKTCERKTCCVRDEESLKKKTEWMENKDFIISTKELPTAGGIWADACPLSIDLDSPPPPSWRDWGSSVELHARSTQAIGYIVSRSDSALFVLYKALACLRYSIPSGDRGSIFENFNLHIRFALAGGDTCHARLKKEHSMLGKKNQSSKLSTTVSMKKA
jgi:hypothetical protein